MAKVNTNDVSLAVAAEASFGKPPLAVTPYRALEPNEISSFGGTVNTVTRAPISPNRQARKGVVTDFDAEVDITSDLTLDTIEMFAGGFTLAKEDSRAGVHPATAAKAGKYVLPDSPEHGAWNLVGALVYASGFANGVNNGVKLVTATADVNDVHELTVAEVFGSGEVIAESGVDARIAVIGVQVSEGNGLSTTAHGFALTVGANVTFVDMGLRPGQWIWVGGDAQINRPLAAGNTPATRANGVGWFKVAPGGVDERALTVIDGPGAVQAGSGNSLAHIYFGQRWHNVPTDSEGKFEEVYYRFEAAYKGLDDGNVRAVQSEFVTGAAPNTMTLSLPLTDKATVQTAFVAKEALPLAAGDAAAVIRGGPGTDAIKPHYKEAFNTSNDFARLALYRYGGVEVDNAYLKSVEIVLTNNYSAEKVLDNTGAKFMNLGTLEVTGTIEALFTDPSVIDGIRNNDAWALRAVLKNDDGAVMFEVPALTLGGGGKDFTVNETVKINLETTAFGDAVFDDSINIQVFHYLPALAGGDA